MLLFLCTAVGLSRSRAKLLGDISSVFSEPDLKVETRLEILENVLLQTDIGTICWDCIESS